MTLAVLTGATRGIGRAAAVELAKRGADVAVVGRDAARVRESAELARRAGDGVVVHEHVADQARFAEVRRLPSELLLAWPALGSAATDLGGEYVEKYRAVKPSERAQDDEPARALWERSAELTGVG